MDSGARACPPEGAGPGTKDGSDEEANRALAEPEADPGRPSSARITNYLLGGHDHTEADRAKAAELEAIVPELRQMAKDSSLFAARAAGYAATEGISQVIDLGAGMPPPPSVHDMAWSVRPGVRVAYVDKDPEACDYLRFVMPGAASEGVGVICEDLRHPAGVWREAVRAGVVRPEEPVCVLATLVLHLMAPAAARALIGQYVRRVAAGSIVALAVPHIGGEVAWKRLAAAYSAVPTWNFGETDVRAVLSGLELVPPGVCDASVLRPGWADCPCRCTPANYVIGGIGRKP